MKKLVSKLRNNKPLKIIYNLLKGIVTIILLLALAVIIIQRVTNNELALGGYRIYTVVTPSMTPEYKIGDILISKEVDPNEIEIGDDVVYLGKEGDFEEKIVTHRVIRISKDKETNKLKFVTKGINNIIEDPEINEDQLYGTIAHKTIFLSFISRIMTSMVGSFVVFAIITLFVSIQIVINIFFNEDDEDDDEDNGETKNNSSKEEIEEL